jgi:hypothetical protein
LAGNLINEPRPRVPVGPWTRFAPPIGPEHVFPRPQDVPNYEFGDVLESRRSALGASLSWSRIAELLWFAAGIRGSHSHGRAGLPVQWSATPSAGGLGCVQIVCISDYDTRPRLYDPFGHRMFELLADQQHVAAANRRTVEALLGEFQGTTLRFIADYSKASAAHCNAESLLWRDAGALLATIGLCATWLGMTACPLGFLGQDLLPSLGFPADVFQGVGGVQIGEMMGQHGNRQRFPDESQFK